MGRYQAYPEYKESGINWLGAVPEHWKVISCRGAVRNRTDKNEGALDQNYLSLMANIGVVTYEDKGDVGNKKPEDLSKCKIVRKGNLVINSMNYAIGSYGMSAYDGVCSPVYIVLDPIQYILEPRFALRVFENKPFQKYLSTFGNGILEHRAAIGWDDIKGAYVAVPPKVEQQCILNFLDHETAKIDALIEKQQQLIQLLKEKRQAVISHAVTKGLNPNAPMKDSGVEWLGEVPEHWDVCRIKQITNFITSGPRGWSDFLNENGENLFLQSGDLNYKLGLELTDAKKVTPPNNAEGIRTKLESGDVVVCITGANTGRVAITPELVDTVYINQHLSLVRPIKSLMDSDYLGLVLSSSSVKSYFSVTQYGLKEGLSLSNVGEAPVCRPPLTEQKEIVQYVRNVSDKYDALESCAEKQVELLRERRIALISTAVTGKIDVRGFSVKTDNSRDTVRANLKK